LQDAKAGNLGETPVVRQEAVAARRDRRHELERVWRLDTGDGAELGRGAQLIAREIDA
jgi:hypothetical protein